MATPHREGTPNLNFRRSSGLRIAVLYDGGADDWSAEDIQSVLEPVWAVSRVLKMAGHSVTQVPVAPGLDWLNAIRHSGLVFNLCEGIGGVSDLEYKVASTLELAGKPYTGARAWTMTVCHQKPLLNAWLRAAGSPIPAWKVVTAVGDLPSDFPLPAIVKPAAEDASVGIDQDSVITSRDALLERICRLRDKFSQLIVQRYIQGRELAVAFVGDRALPISEIDFSDMPEGTWPILSFDAKWVPGSPEDVGSQPVCPAALEPKLHAHVMAVATAAWRAVDGCGYGRVDLRVGSDGRPWIIEVNPNPDISTDAGLARMARAGGWSYPQLVERIVKAALPDPKRAAPVHSPTTQRRGQAAASGGIT